MGNELLGRKQRVTNEAWLEVFGKIEQLVPREQLDEKVRQQ